MGNSRPGREIMEVPFLLVKLSTELRPGRHMHHPPILEQLCPPPRHAAAAPPWHLPRNVRVGLPRDLPADAMPVRRLHDHLAAIGKTLERVDPREDSQHLRVRLDETLDLPREGYRLILDDGGGLLEASTAAGLFYGVATLGQWLRLHPAIDDEVPGLRVNDWPDYPQRGVMLDISRNKVPRRQTLEDLIDLLADCKINHLQLYTEHTFAYRGHETVWRDASPLTADDVRHLQSYCRDRHIELVPNQNSFGHFHRWLIHDPYRRLAECPEGIEHPFSDVREPFSLCPVDDDAVALLEDLYDQLLPLFDSPLVNVGLDETMDLGTGRSAAACRQRGKATVYLEFLLRIHGALKARGRRMMYWGDVVLEHPEMIPDLPKDGIVLAWGYEANFPFADKARQFAASGLEFWMCPGTSTWSSFAGRGENALLNLGRAAVEGRRQGSQGYLITEWGDHGHLQPLFTCYLGFVAGAAFAWNVDCAQDPLGVPIARWLDAHAFRDPRNVLGALTVDLANTYLHTNAPPPGGDKINGSALFFEIAFAHKSAAQRRGHGMTPAHLEATRRHIAQTLSRVPTSEGGVEQEMRWLADILDLSCRLALGRFEIGLDAPLHELTETLRRDLDATLGDLIERRRRLWLARNRPGGWELSAQKLQRVRHLLYPSAP